MKSRGHDQFVTGQIRAWRYDIDGYLAIVKGTIKLLNKTWIVEPGIITLNLKSKARVIAVYHSHSRFDK